MTPGTITELRVNGPLPKIGVTSVTPRITFAKLVMPEAKTLSCSMFTEFHPQVESNYSRLDLTLVSVPMCITRDGLRCEQATRATRGG